MGSDDSEEADKRDRVLAPDDLDITKQPEVEEIDDGRYVVSPSGPAKKPDRRLLENPDWLDNEADEDKVDKPDETAPQRRDDPSQSQSTPTESTQPADRGQSTNPTQQASGGQSTAPTNTPTDRSQSPDQPPSTDQSTAHQPSQSPLDQSTPDQSTPDQSTQTTPTQADHSPSQPQQSTPPHNAEPTTQSPSQANQSTSSRSDQSSPSQANQSTPTQPDQSSPSQADQSTSSRPDQPTNRDLAAHDQPPAEPPTAELTNESVSKFLAESLAQSSGDYGFDATLNVEGKVNRGRMTSDDIGETLETLLRWYARQTTEEVEPEVVLGIILAGSDLAVEYPVQSAYSMVKQYGLGPDDSISDLLAAVREQGTFSIPPSKE